MLHEAKSICYYGEGVADMRGADRAQEEEKCTGNEFGVRSVRTVEDGHHQVQRLLRL